MYRTLFCFLHSASLYEYNVGILALRSNFQTSRQRPSVSIELSDAGFLGFRKESRADKGDGRLKRRVRVLHGIMPWSVPRGTLVAWPVPAACPISAPFRPRVGHHQGGGEVVAV